MENYAQELGGASKQQDESEDEIYDRAMEEETKLDLKKEALWDNHKENCAGCALCEN
jgi:hypothetical protein